MKTQQGCRGFKEAAEPCSHTGKHEGSMQEQLKVYYLTFLFPLSTHTHSPPHLINFAAARQSSRNLADQDRKA